MKKIITLLLSAVLVVGMLIVPGTPAHANDDNLALGKPVTAKSSRDGYNPEVVVDGNRKNMWAGSSGVDGNWVMVDLEDAYILTSIVVQPRSDADVTYYRGNIHIQISNSPTFESYETVFSNIYTSGGEFANIPPFGEPIEIKLTSRTPYRYVRAVRMDTNTFGLNEIEVYGYQIDPNSLSVGTDVVGTRREGPITLLRYLGLMDLKNSIEDVFGVNTLLSRGEAAEAVVKAFAGNVAVSGESPFSDVNKGHAYYEAVTKAYQLGYITGDGNASFRPDDYITKTEFLFMTLRGMGYGDVVANNYNNNASSIIELAKRLNLFKSVSVQDYGEPITRGDAAMTFYNALLAPGLTVSSVEQQQLIYGKDSDLLRRSHNIILSQGLVEETRITTLDGDTKTNQNEVQVGGHKFVDPAGKLDNFLGKQVVIATNADDSSKVVHIAWSAQQDTEVVLPAGSLISTEADIHNGYIVALNENDKDDKYKLSSPYYVVKNGIVDPYYMDKATSDLRLQNGQLRLLDNNDDGLYEVVFVEEYTLHYVKTAFYDDRDFTFIDSNGTKKVLKRDSLVITDGYGNSINQKNVAADTVIKFFGNSNGENCKIVLFNEPVTGTLTTRSNAEVTVDSVKYPLSIVYQNTVRNPEPAPGEAVYAFVDEAGEVIWIERNLDILDGEWTIALSQKVAFGVGLDDSLGFRLFTEDGVWKELYVADKVIVDGSSQTRKQLSALVRTTSEGRFTGELLRFKLNGAGNIKEIDTIETTSEEIGVNNIKMGDLIGTALYTTGSEAFWSGDEMLFQAKRNATVFQVPLESNAVATGSSYDLQYKVTTLDSVVSSHNVTTQDVRPYFFEGKEYTAVCFRDNVTVTAPNGAYSAIESTTAPYLLVEDVCQVATEEGQVVLQLKGQNITNIGISGEATVLVDPNYFMLESGRIYQEKPSLLKSNVSLPDVGLIDFTLLTDEDKRNYTSSINDIGFGDIIRYQSGTPTAYAVERVFDYNELVLPILGGSPQDVWYKVGKNYNYYHVYYRYQLGELTNVEKDSFAISTVSGKEEHYRNTAFAAMYVCDTNGRDYKLTKVTDLSRYVGASYRLMLYSYNGAPRMIIIYPYSN